MRVCAPEYMTKTAAQFVQSQWCIRAMGIAMHHITATSACNNTVGATVVVSLPQPPPRWCKFRLLEPENFRAMILKGVRMPRDKVMTYYSLVHAISSLTSKVSISDRGIAYRNPRQGREYDLLTCTRPHARS